MDSNEEQPENALSPIVLTNIGIVMNIKEEQPLNV